MSLLMRAYEKAYYPMARARYLERYSEYVQENVRAASMGLDPESKKRFDLFTAADAEEFTVRTVRDAHTFIENRVTEIEAYTEEEEREVDKLT